MDNKEFWSSISAIIRNGFNIEGLNKAEIYKQMTKWFERKTSCDVEACRIMVSFFVQDCEIYEELP